ENHAIRADHASGARNRRAAVTVSAWHRERQFGNAPRPDQRNARSRKRTRPTTRIATDEVTTAGCAHRVRRIRNRRGRQSATTRACPTSTPTLKPRSESSRPWAGSPSSRSAEEKPKPWTRPKQKLTSQRRETAGFPRIFSAAT